MAANPELVHRQGIDEEAVGNINHLHIIRKILHESLHNGNLKPSLSLGKFLGDIESQLQELWKFDINPNFYKYWYVPTCRCPKMDNNDNFPHGYYITQNDCPLHGVEAENNGKEYEGEFERV